MKRKYVYFVLGILISVGVVSCFMKPKYSNIFEEIYHDEYYHATRPIPDASTLRKMDSMEDADKYDLLNDNMIEKYKADILPNGVKSIVYDFSYPNRHLDNGAMSIEIRYDIGSYNTIAVVYDYVHRSNIVTREIYIISEKKRIVDSEEILLFLKANNIDVSKLYSESFKLLKTKIISDWLKAYSSQFTLENWGNVEIVTSKEYLE